ncbi:hypothetical protein IAD21_05961 [Abditibacteriota bacterium]|nr:hypothetical protein IAD21_05961 [Abditibacteriota bacterium]
MEPILGILLGGFLAFNAFVTPGRAEKEAESALRKKFPGATVNVDIEGKRGRNVLKGRFKKVRVELSNLRIDDFPIQAGAEVSTTTGAAPAPKFSTIGHLELSLHDLSFGGLPVKSVELSFDDVHYDFEALKKRSEIRLISFTNGKIALAIEANSLLPLVAKRAPEIKDAHVELRGGEIVVTGRREILGAGANVLVRGPIVPHGNDLDLDNAHVEVAGLNIAPILAAPIIKGINPLYSFEEKWPFNVQTGHIGADNDMLQIEGTLTAK